MGYYIAYGGGGSLHGCPGQGGLLYSIRGGGGSLHGCPGQGGLLYSIRGGGGGSLHGCPGQGGLLYSIRGGHFTAVVDKVGYYDHYNNTYITVQAGMHKKGEESLLHLIIL